MDCCSHSLGRSQACSWHPNVLGLPTQVEGHPDAVYTSLLPAQSPPRCPLSLGSHSSTKKSPTKCQIDENVIVHKVRSQIAVCIWEVGRWSSLRRMDNNHWGNIGVKWMSLTQLSVLTKEHPSATSKGTDSSFLAQNQTLMKESVLSTAYLINRLVRHPTYKSNRQRTSLRRCCWRKVHNST